MKRVLPPFIISSFFLITFNLFIAGKNDPGIFIKSPLTVLSQLCALWGLQTMSLTLLLSTKVRFIEKLFDGLDQMRLYHRLLGLLSGILLIQHPVLLAIQALPSTKQSLMYLFPATQFSYTAGVLAVYLLILTLVTTIFIKLPYHIWMITHRILGVSFILGTLHALLIGSDIGVNLALRYWIGFWSLVGIGALLYHIFYRRLGPKLKYRVLQTQVDNDTVHIYLTPLTAKTLDFRPGQFVYVCFYNKKIGKELHPFTVSSAPKDHFLRISAKVVGDYTSRLINLVPGDIADLYGPFGNFLQEKMAGRKVLWVSGGIGATPFTSKIRSLQENQTTDTIYFYCYRQRLGVLGKEIETALPALPSLNWIPWCTSIQGRLDMSHINKHFPILSFDAAYLCGPPSMMEKLKKQLIFLGMREESVYFERFALV